MKNIMISIAAKFVQLYLRILLTVFFAGVHINNLLCIAHFLLMPEKNVLWIVVTILLNVIKFVFPVIWRNIPIKKNAFFDQVFDLREEKKK